MEITGRIVNTTELGFELADDANRHHPFKVALDAFLEAGDLSALAQDGTRVVVIADADTAEVPVAYRVFRAPSG